MPRYRVSMVRKGYRAASLYIQATSEDDAREEAQAGDEDIDWGDEYDCDDEILQVEEVPEEPMKTPEPTKEELVKRLEKVEGLLAEAYETSDGCSSCLGCDRVVEWQDEVGALLHPDRPSGKNRGEMIERAQALVSAVDEAIRQQDIREELAQACDRLKEVLP